MDYSNCPSAPADGEPRMETQMPEQPGITTTQYRSRPARSRRPAEETREEILEEAKRLFSIRGYRRTTIAEVAKGVGITDAGVLHHFATKRDLLTAVLSKSTEHQAEMFKDLLDKGGVDALNAFGEWGRVMESEPYHMGLEVVLSAEALDAPSALHDFFIRRYKVLNRWLIRAFQQGIESGDIRDDVDIKREVSSLVAYLDGMRLQWFFKINTDLGPSVRDYVDHLLERISTP